MATGKRYYWLKLHDDFFSSKRIKKLRKMAGGDTYTIIYLKLQLLSIKTDGVIKFSGIEDNIADELALDLDESPDDVRVTLNYLMSCGLMETNDEINFFLPYAVENTGSETAGTQRVRDFRARQKALQCNADETLLKRDCNVEKEIEKDKETEIDASLPEAEAAAPCPFGEIWRLYHSICVSYPKILHIDGQRRKAVAARWRTNPHIETFEELFGIAERSAFLKGENSRNWSADFDWMMNATNFSKILEHKYDDKHEKKQETSGSAAGYDLDKLWEAAVKRGLEDF